MIRNNGIHHFRADKPSILANMILVGKALKESGAVPFEGKRQKLESVIPAKKADLIDINCQMLQTGYDY